ncbi:MAG TPA: Uma2 family endonuclease [Bacilli bacterium]
MEYNKKPNKKPDHLREQPMTYGEYADLPDDGNRYELVEGFLEMMSPSATTKHQMISFQIQKKLAQSCEHEYFILNAPLDVILSPKEVRQPDLVMIHRGRIHIMKKYGIEGAPDLVVEILSLSSIKRDKVNKLKSYAYYAIPEYWIVDPGNGTLEQYVLQDKSYELVEVYTEDEIIKSNHIPCVSFSMKEIMNQIPDLYDH